MKTFLKVVGVVGAVGLMTVTQVAAVGLPGIRAGLRQEVREEAREDRGDDAREREATKPGLFGKLFNKNGRAAVGSVTLTAKNGTTLTVTDKDGKTLTINTDGKTQFRRRFWGKSSLDEMNVGDALTIIGQWTDDAHTTILARLVRDTSIQKRFGVFFGSVTSTSASGWVMNTVNRGSQTVTVTSSTKLVDRKGQTIAQSAIVTGHKVRVRGLWDSKLNTITEVAEAKDFTLPVVPTPTATP